MKFKAQFSILLVGCMFVLSGCYSAFDNQTPKMVPQNPSNSYRISMRVKKANVNIIPDSYRARIVIDGQAREMVKTGNKEFYFDYKLPDEDQHVINYCYEVDYIVGKNKRTMRSENFKLDIINRYVVGFECNRGKPYSRVSLLGRGFLEGDQVVIGGYLCETTFVSPNVLTFTVPLILGGRPYSAVLESVNGDIGLGEFLVDPLAISASPNVIVLQSRDKQVLSVFIDIDAPATGLPLDITTDIPDSVIMHEVSVRPGVRSARVVVEGGEPGKGSLFINAPGFSECVVPITVTGDEPAADSGGAEYSSLTDSDNDIILEEDNLAG